MTCRVVLQPRAELDIQARAAWLLGRSENRRPWRCGGCAGLRAKIATLKTSPERCPLDSDSDAYGEEVRVLLHGKRPGTYRVLFAVRGETVHVLTVRHSAQRSLSEQRGLQEEEEQQP